MKFLLVNTDYPDFGRTLYEGRPELDRAPYDEQLAARSESLFGTANFYSTTLCELGHDAFDVHVNVEPLQRAWAQEHGIAVSAPEQGRSLPERVIRRLRRPTRGWFETILSAQVRHHRPDVLFVQDMIHVTPSLLRELRAAVGLVIGQHAATPLPYDADELGAYDLVTSSFGPTVDAMLRLGVPAELHRLAFEPRVLDSIGPSPGPRYDVTFVGSLFAGVHDSRRHLLELLCDRFPTLRVFGPGVDSLPVGSSIRSHHAGPAWGREMYEVLRDSRVTVNEHGSIPDYANNCRLYEATGVGTLLVTDARANLAALFEPGREVAAYRSPEECAELVAYYLAHDEERAAIAAAGQARTLSEHTFRSRAEELVELVERYGRRP